MNGDGKNVTIRYHLAVFKKINKLICCWVSFFFRKLHKKDGSQRWQRDPDGMAFDAMARSRIAAK